MTENGGYDFDFDSEPENNITKNDPKKRSDLKSKLPEISANKQQEIISLENFDPFNKIKKINSPRSMAICATYGILLDCLYHRNYSEIRGICFI